MPPDLEAACARYRAAMEAWIADAFSPEGAFHSETWREFDRATHQMKAALRRHGGAAEYRGRTYRLDKNGYVYTLLIPPPEEVELCPIPSETSFALEPPTSKPPSRRRKASSPGPNRS